MAPYESIRDWFRAYQGNRWNTYNAGCKTMCSARSANQRVVCGTLNSARADRKIGLILGSFTRKA